ncbi:MAG TPA: N-methylproline demethylase, partial [Thiolinea sp.]|nr:N-methylproline demethylase [Thiolinea sp.]
KVTFTITYRLLAVEKSAAGFTAVIGSDYGAWQQREEYDQIIVNHGTLPLDELYFELKPQSKNLGAVDYEQLLAGTSQSTVKNPEGQFLLYRIGDAVAARNTHAAIYDALRLMKDI